MKKAFHALRTWFRGNRTSARRPPRLAVELLEDRLAPATTFQSIIGADSVLSQYPYRGAGYSVAILDTGIDYNDTDLGGGFGPGHRVVAGYNFVNNTANPMDDNGHGTNLAGIIGSSNPSDPGIAPGVDFVALKVLDANMNGTWTAVDDALQWVIANQAKYNIVDVNLSLGAGNYTSNPYSLLESDFSTLKDLGVFIAVAAGNNYYTYDSQPGLAYPAISPNVVSVGATWTASSTTSTTFQSGAIETVPTLNHIVSITQRSSDLSILAPGVWITSDWLNNTMQTMGGTSMATAVVSGAAVLLHQAYDETGQSALANQNDILKLMQATGTTIVDLNYGTDNVAHTGLSFKLLNLKAAMDTIGQPVAAPTFAPIANQTLYVNGATVVPLSVTSPSGGTITYSATDAYLPALAYQLDQQYGFNYLGSYYQNSRGLNEKWIIGAGNVWYAILPDGEVRRWTGSTSDMMTAANLIATLNASYWSDPTKLWNAPYAAMPPVVFSFAGNQLTILGPAYWVGTYSVTVTANDGHYAVPHSFNVTEVPHVPPVLAAIANVTTSHGQSATITLNGSDPDGDLLTYSAQVLPVNGVTPALKAAVSGNLLTLQASQPIIGTFTISATANDGYASATQTFTLTLTNSAPVLGAVAAQTMAKGQTSLTVALPASDPDNDKLSYQAVAEVPNAQLYQLDQQYDFQQSNPTYYLNIQGHNEKWLTGKNNTWYALLPNGQLYQWDLNMAQTLTAANLIATLDPSVYTEPRLLWNANPPAAPALTFSFVGNQLTIQRPATLTGVFYIDVTVSDGWLTAKQTIEVTLN